MSEDGDEPGKGKRGRKNPQPAHHDPPALLKIHRDKLQICKGVSYELRAIGYDMHNRPVPPGRLLWKSQNPTVASVHPDRGLLEAKTAGLASITVSNTTGITSAPTLVQVHEARDILIKTLPPAKVGSNRRLPLAVAVVTASHQTIRDPVVAWQSNDLRVATVGQDGILVGGEVGEAEITAEAAGVASTPLDVEVVEGVAGKPKGGGKGRPRILLSGQDLCPFDHSSVFLDPSDPLVFQRPHKQDYEYNVFWINLQHPLPDALLKSGEDTVQWRTYHFQRVVDVYLSLLLRQRFGDDQSLDVDALLTEMQPIVAEIYAAAKEDPEIFDLLFKEDIDLPQL